jgi:hypothetical protein
MRCYLEQSTVEPSFNARRFKGFAPFLVQFQWSQINIFSVKLFKNFLGLVLNSTYPQRNRKFGLTVLCFIKLFNEIYF